MPSVANIAGALATYQGRYRYLDAFVDDIDEFRTEQLPAGTTVVQTAAPPKLLIPSAAGPLFVEVFPQQGVARFYRASGGEPGAGQAVAAGVALGGLLGGLLGTAVGSAAKAKEGLLGGLVLGMLVGGLAGAAASSPHVERALALQFDPAQNKWVLYDGPLLRWAKRTLVPVA